MPIIFNRKSIFFLFFTILTTFSIAHSQELTGVITDSINNPISNATVAVREKENSSILYYGTSNQEGLYRIKLDKSFSKMIIEYRSLGYVTRTIEISDIAIGSIKAIDVQLLSDILNLQEVTVISKKKPIVVKKDTLVYNIESFKDGTETVVEDMLKKLPGIKVNAEGKIFFKGKAIKGLLLDGDNLFDQNYQIGSKNIDIDLIDEISAIENYISNPLLSGISNSDDVALNLTLKNGAFDFSNDNDIGVGIENRLNVKSNILGISKIIKSFSTLSYNNIGKEYSPYDYFSGTSASLDNSDENQQLNTKIIPEGSFISDVGAERSRINRNLFSSFNSIFKISEKIESKINIDFKNDRLLREENSFIEYTFDPDLSDVNQVVNRVKNPTLFNSKLELDYKVSKSALLKSRSSYRTTNIRESNNSLTNNFSQESRLKSRESIFKQEFDYTKKVNKNTAFTSLLSTNFSSLPQTLVITPEVRFDSINGSIQSVGFNNFQLDHTNTFIKKINTDIIKLSAGFSLRDSNLNTSLESTNNVVSSINTVDYTYSYPWIEGDYYKQINKWRFKANLKFWFLSKSIEYNTNPELNESINRFIVMPKVNVSYNLNSKSSIRLSGNYKENPIDVNRLFSNIVFTSVSNSITNTTNLETLKGYTTSLEYSYYDFFNLFQFRSGISYSVRTNNFLSRFEINDFLVTTNRLLSDVDFKTISINSSVDTYLNFFKSNLKVNVVYGINDFSNLINDSDLRENRSYSGLVEATIKTGFLNSINFENSIQYFTNTFRSKGFRSISNSSFRNTFKFYVIPSKRIQFITSMDYIRPNLNNKDNFIFFDTELVYTPKNNKVSYSLTSKNITSRPSIFQTTSVSDFANSINSYSIVEPYILFSVKFKL